MHTCGLGTFESNEIYENAGSGIDVETDGNPRVVGNRIHDGQTSGVAVHNDGQGDFEKNMIFAKPIIFLK